SVNSRADRSEMGDRSDGTERSDRSRQGNNPNRRMLWYMENNEIKFLPVFIGSTDGYKTEITAREIPENIKIITGVKNSSASGSKADAPAMNMRRLPF
ncbi:MAG: hypothetical protein PHR06_05575, partial [Candidatus Cloacimonetes bacterium]|nr:hypothetical protein [Candidatus Cloacimonadota bacterium]